MLIVLEACGFHPKAIQMGGASIAASWPLNHLRSQGAVGKRAKERILLRARSEEFAWQTEATRSRCPTTRTAGLTESLRKRFRFGIGVGGREAGRYASTSGKCLATT